MNHVRNIKKLLITYNQYDTEMKKKYFTNIEILKQQCKQVVEKRNNPIDVVELWTPCYLNDSESKREVNIEVLRVDGYYDRIYFKVGDEKLADDVYNELKSYNREITPLEIFHASF